jgi:hypothetical protein
MSVVRPSDDRPDRGERADAPASPLPASGSTASCGLRRSTDPWRPGLVAESESRLGWAEHFHVSQTLRSAGCLFVGDEGSAADEVHGYATIRSRLPGVPSRVPVHTGNVCHHVDLHGLTPQLQDAALLEHILSCDLFGSGSVCNWRAGNSARSRLSAGSGRLKRRLRPRLAALQGDATQN